MLLGYCVIEVVNLKSISWHTLKRLRGFRVVIPETFQAEVGVDVLLSGVISL